MTLRHYGRALAALSGAALLCATLSVPAFATPTSDTDAAAPTVVAATDEESAPITVTATVSCRVELSDLGLVFLPGATTVTASSTAPVDTWRGTR